MRKSKLARAEIARLYTEGLFTMQEIGVMSGISKQAVHNALVALGVEYRGEPIERLCHYCKQPFHAQRKRIKRGTGQYCSITCFHAERVINPERYVVISQADRRKGSRVARKILDVKGEDVVHHIDGDPTNNNWGGSDRASLG